MRDFLDPTRNHAALVQRYIGEAYHNVKLVAENLPSLLKLSKISTVLGDLARAIPTMKLFVESPDFLPWLNTNRDALEDLTVAVTALDRDIVRFKTVTGVIGEVDVRVSVDNPIADNQDIVSLSGSIVTTDGMAYSIGSFPGLSVWVDALTVNVMITESTATLEGATFSVILGYKE